VEITDDSPVTIGRGSSNTLVIHDSSISRRHCTVTKQDSDYVLTDDGSSNGTFVNGKRVARAVLNDDCEIRLGLSLLKFKRIAPIEGADIKFCAKCNGSIPKPDIEANLYVEIRGKFYCKECTGLENNLLGKHLGKYVLQELIGKGGIGAVYKAKRTDLDITVAVKILHPQLTRDDTTLKRFFREARTGAKLSHPNIVRLIDVGSVGSIYFLVMEYINGSSLADLLRDKGALPWPEALRIATEVAEALVHAHSRGVIHRDLKPENILLEDNKTPKLVDLGLSKSTDTASSMLTVAGIVMGTPAYMSPEQATDARLADVRSDIYAFGATFYHMLGGAAPFTGESLMKILRKVTSEQPRPLRAVNPDVPEALAAIVEKAMAKNPADRYQTAAELLNELRAAAQKLSGAA